MLLLPSMSGEVYGDRVLELGLSGDDVQELQVKLGGWFSDSARPRWDGNFDAATQEAVVRFQEAHNLEATGIVDHWTFQRIDNERYDHFFDLEGFKCPTRGRKGCNGFGTGQTSFYLPESARTIAIPGGEPNGVNKALVWLLRGVMHRGNFSYTTRSGYRCAHDNVFKNRSTINHIGNAIDIAPYRPDWSSGVTTYGLDFSGSMYEVRETEAVQNARMFFELAGIPNDVRASNVVYMERDVPLEYGGYYAGTWVHIDLTTALDAIGGTPEAWYVTNRYDLNHPYYNNQLVSSASAAPPAGPQPPALPPSLAAEAESTLESRAGWEAWQNYHTSVLTNLDDDAISLANDTEHSIEVPSTEGYIDLIIEAHENGRAGFRREMLRNADLMDAFRRSALMSAHTRMDYRQRGRVDAERLRALLNHNHRNFKRRYEALLQALRDC